MFKKLDDCFTIERCKQTVYNTGSIKNLFSVRLMDEKTLFTHPLCSTLLIPCSEPTTASSAMNGTYCSLHRQAAEHWASTCSIERLGASVWLLYGNGKHEYYPGTLLCMLSNGCDTHDNLRLVTFLLLY